MRRFQNERGFTLVELLVAIAILGVIVFPLSAGIMIGFRAMTGTTDTYARSSDAQFISTYFPADVQSANSATTTTAVCTGTTQANQKLRLTSTEGATIVRVVVYWTRLTSGKYELVRSVWSNSAGASCTSGNANQTVVVARNLTALTSATATINAKLVRMAVTTTGYAFTVSGRMRSA